MRKKWLLLLGALLCTAVTVVEADRVKRGDLADGVRWTYHRYDNLYGNRQTVNVLEIDLTRPILEIKPVHAPSGATTSSLGKKYQALAGVNGGYFWQGSSVSMVKIDGQLLATNPGHRPPRATLGLAPGLAEIKRVASTESWDEMKQVLGGGPGILSLFEIKVTRGEEGFNQSYADRHPRTAAGITPDRRLILVTVDGRTSAGAGMLLPELARYLQELGCRDAMNLDGGGSTTMWISGQPCAGVVNYPYDNGRPDHYGERPVVSALFVWQVEAMRTDR